MKLTAQDYRNAMQVTYEFDMDYSDYKCPYFEPYCQAKIAELEKPEPQMYRCIQLPTMYNLGTFELGKMYSADWRCCGFRMLDLPNHFELVEPKPETEKITMQDISNMLKMGFDNRSIGGAASEVIDRIKKDHLS